MSIFGEILNRLRGKSRPASENQGLPPANAPAGGAPPSAQTGTPPATAPVVAGATAGGTATGGTPTAGTAGTGTGATATTAAQSPLSEVDVGRILDDLVRESGQNLNWRASIVDMMKALGLDSSLEHRKELARELQYNGDTNDSAAMNTWLHKRVMQELAANGGKLPPELRD